MLFAVHSEAIKLVKIAILIGMLTFLAGHGRFDFYLT